MKLPLNALPLLSKLPHIAIPAIGYPPNAYDLLRASIARVLGCTVSYNTTLGALLVAYGLPLGWTNDLPAPEVNWRIELAWAVWNETVGDITAVVRVLRGEA